MLFTDGRRQIRYDTAAPTRVWATRANDLAKAQEAPWPDWRRSGIVPEVSGQTQIHHSAGTEVRAGNLENGRYDDHCHLGVCNVLGRMVRCRVCVVDICSRVRPFAGRQEAWVESRRAGF